MPLRDTAGRPKAVFLLLACCTQEENAPPPGVWPVHDGAYSSAIAFAVLGARMKPGNDGG
jgi:hypothetical protein